MYPNSHIFIRNKIIKCVYPAYTTYWVYLLTFCRWKRLDHLLLRPWCLQLFVVTVYSGLLAVTQVILWRLPRQVRTTPLKASHQLLTPLSAIPCLPKRAHIQWKQVWPLTPWDNTEGPHGSQAPCGVGWGSVEMVSHFSSLLCLLLPSLPQQMAILINHPHLNLWFSLIPWYCWWKCGLT